MTQEQVPVGKQLVTVGTGEVVTDYRRIVDNVVPDRSRFIEDIFNEDSRKPIHLRIAEQMGVSTKEAQSYWGQVPVKSEDMKDRIITIIGMVPWFSGDVERNDGQGTIVQYNKVLFKLKETKDKDITYVDPKTGKKSLITIKKNIIMSTGAKRIVTFGAHLADSFGFYDWKDGNEVTVIISVVDKEQEIDSIELEDLPKDI